MRRCRASRLRARVLGSDICLGVFGTSDKAGRVVPNKVYDALAAGRPLVTADSPAARELLGDGRDALLVPAGDAGALAAALRRLGDVGERARLGGGALALYRRRCTPEAVRAALLAALEASFVSGGEAAAPRRRSSLAFRIVQVVFAVAVVSLHRALPAARLAGGARLPLAAAGPGLLAISAVLVLCYYLLSALVPVVDPGAPLGLPAVPRRTMARPGRSRSSRATCRATSSCS